MKFLTSLMPFLAMIGAAKAAANHDDCTHGKLLVTDANTNILRVYNLNADGDDLSNLSPETIMEFPGGPGASLRTSKDNAFFATVYGGDTEKNYTGGKVRWYHTGIAKLYGDQYGALYGDIKEVENAGIDCVRAIHFVSHNGYTAIFCDGSHTTEPRINSTIWIQDDSKFGLDVDDEPALIYTEVLEGSHHGVAIAFSDDLFMISEATPDRIMGTEAGEDHWAPPTYRFVDGSGAQVASVGDLTTPDAHCSGFHGEWAHHDEIAMGCDSTHGGVLRMTVDPETMTVTSRAVEYPANLSVHRTGTFIGSDDVSFMVGNLAPDYDYEPEEGEVLPTFLYAMEPDDDTIDDNQVFELPDTLCSFAFEQGRGDHIIAVLQTGMMHVLQYKNEEWTDLASAQLTEGPLDGCWGFMVLTPGFGQAFVSVKEDKMLYAVDLSMADEGELAVHSTKLDYMPNALRVAGAPKEVACNSNYDADDHDHDDHDHDENTDLDVGKAGP